VSLGDTKLHCTDLKTLWLLGDPVSHSMSPLIQNTALQALDENVIYLASQVKAEVFETAVRALPALGALGANVTVPHKLRAFDLCDSLSGRARVMRAVNTLHFRDGEIFGDNTDGVGWWNSVRCDFASDSFEKAVVIGAGGAARAVCHTLVGQGVKTLVLLNRTAANAEKLKDELPDGVDVRVDGLKSFPRHLTAATLVAQTTSVGLKGEDAPVPLPKEWPDGCCLSELIYGHETPLLTAVRTLGGATADGLGMLCGQAAESLALWTGRPVEEIPYAEMMRVARERLS
jgi:shikimate dehydrogenase